MRRQKRPGLIADVPKLRIPINVTAAFLGFTIRLQTIS
jgi:hypothetical protein